MGPNRATLRHAPPWVLSPMAYPGLPLAMHKATLSLLVLAVPALTSLVEAQSNVVPGLDIRLLTASQIQRYRRTGTYPNGVQAIGIRTTCCNPGTVQIPFQAAMNPNHGFIHYIVARETGNRFQQISNYAWVKHTFGSNNDPSVCGNCTNTQTTSFVHVGCSDTYLNSQAVDHFNLGPPSEVDPWLGTWNPICSYFDQGNPVVTPSQQCDGIRSLTSAQASVLNQGIGLTMRVYDDDFNKPGNYYYQAGYLVPGEAEATRYDNIASRKFTPTWNASTNQWDLPEDATLVPDSILNRWSGATVTSNTNGGDDGRFYVGVKVTGPTDGYYHYEFAVHNRDNKRGMGALHIPVCPEAQVKNIGFHDFDRDALTDWVGAKSGSEIVFQLPSGGTNALRWNSIFNFYFDCDAAPASGSVLLDQYDIGPGALSVTVGTTTPAGVYNVNLGPGCGLPNAPVLYATGAPARGLIGNSTLGLRCISNPANMPCAFVLSSVPGSTSLGGGCTVYTGDPLTLLGPLVALSDATGAATVPIGVPNNPTLEGLDFDFQEIGFAAGGPVLGNFNLSNGLRVRVGDMIGQCP